MRGRGYGVAVGLVLCATASAEIYKCTDPATGQTTFSQTQCAVDAEAVTVDVTRPSQSAVADHNALWSGIIADQEQARRVREAELRAAQARRAAAAMNPPISSAEARNRRIRERKHIESLGPAVSKFSQGDYSSTMYRSGGTYTTIRREKGKITGESVYQTR